MFFAKPVDLRNRSSVVDFLKMHSRYSTANSWNRGSSFSHCVKISRLGLTHAQRDAAHALLAAEGVWDHLQYSIDDFTQRMGGVYTIGSNGRSGGYLVLYSSCYEDTGYKSHCRSCGQRNFKLVEPQVGNAAEQVVLQSVIRLGSGHSASTYQQLPAIAALQLSDDELLRLVVKHRQLAGQTTIGNKCGACGKHDRANYLFSPKSLRVSLASVGEDIDDMNFSALRELARVVMEFDKACDAVRADFIQLTEEFEVEEQTVMVPRKVHVMVPKSSPATADATPGEQ